MVYVVFRCLPRRTICILPTAALANGALLTVSAMETLDAIRHGKPSAAFSATATPSLYAVTVTDTIS